MTSKDSENPHAGRKLVDIAQKARGRTPLKYELEVIPFFAGELPSGLEKVAFVWERGAKVFRTDAETVNPHTRAAFWKQYLRQTATLYKDNGRLLAKEYIFKIQHERGSGDSSTWKTVGKIKVDMSQFCSEETAPIPQEVFLQLKPAGKLKLSVKCTWLKNAKVDMDALTEASFTTHRSTDAGAAAANEYEQDLTGFDHLDSGSTSHSHHHKIQSREPAGSPRHAASSNSGNDSSSSAMHSKATIESIQAGGLQVFPRSPRIPAAGTYNKAVNNLHGSIAPFEVGLSPEEEKAAIQQEKARQAAFQQAELQKMRQKMEDQLRMELNDALSQHSQRSWRDIFCCCLPTKQVRIRTTHELVNRAEDESTLLSSRGMDL